MKYIIEIKPEYEGTTKGIIVLGIKNNRLCVDELAIEELEELNAEYINNHFPDITKKVEEAYQKGLDDAWEAARKIVCDDELDWNTLLHIFNRSNFEGIFGDFSPSEAIAKLKAYEEKQKADDEIKVRDEVIAYGCRGVVTYVHKNLYTVMMSDGSCGNWGKGELKKTGKKHDIDKIMEEMKECSSD